VQKTDEEEDGGWDKSIPLPLAAALSGTPKQTGRNAPPSVRPSVLGELLGFYGGMHPGL